MFDGYNTQCKLIDQMDTDKLCLLLLPQRITGKIASPQVQLRSEMSTSGFNWWIQSQLLICCWGHRCSANVTTDLAKFVKSNRLHRTEKGAGSSWSLLAFVSLGPWRQWLKMRHTLRPGHARHRVTAVSRPYPKSKTEKNILYDQCALPLFQNLQYGLCIDNCILYSEPDKFNDFLPGVG